MKVIIVAEHASTLFGGEAHNPLHYFRELRSRNIEVWLVVHDRTKAELQKLFPEDFERIFFVKGTFLHRLLWRNQQLLPRKFGEVTLGLLSQMYTQMLQRPIIQKLVIEHEIDVVHQPIQLAPKYPSLMFNLGVPVIIGPMNGGMTFPPSFRYYCQGFFVEQTVTIGRFFSNVIHRILPGKLKAQVLLVANERTKQALPKAVQGRVIELVDNGVDLSVWQSSTKVAEKPNHIVSFVYVGRLVDWKGVDLLLEAFHRVIAETNATLEIIGDGKLRSKLEFQAERLGLNGNVVFTGWLSQKQCACKLQQADVMVLPSLYESGGAVVLEAMAMGIPVIATNWGGPTDYLDSTCGILIEPSSKEAFVNGLKEGMLKLARNPDLRKQMGRSGQELVQLKFDWKSKIDQIIEIYKTCI
ncbi:glycosyltransferase family 4 protein [Coleofasciculus sp.]|uniref:glycosyltransferase family 4 protein n=1 Tax=Coleofasciculus sp. TaxID=3100458 RepID=UPI0039FB54B9